MTRLTVWFLILVFWGCAPKLSQVTFEPGVKPRNIILMIGDGMSVSQISAGMYSIKNRLQLERFKTIGFHKATSGNDLITDSAAGATAFASGVKTYNSAVGVGMDTLPVKTILEQAEDRGIATGLVVTSTIVHATPAAFYAHVPWREMYEEIALDLLKVDLELFIGGGQYYFDNRRDEQVLTEALKKRGYYISNNFQEDFGDINFYAHGKIGYFTASKDPLPNLAGRDYLPLAVNRASRFLLSKAHVYRTGFFMMVEGSQIDWGGHANKTDFVIAEMLDFDEAIGEALDFAEKDKETLVIVTGDHECGGLSITRGSLQGQLIGAFNSVDHTADLVPVFAYGPGAEAFAGIYENTDIYFKIAEALRLNEKN